MAVRYIVGEMHQYEWYPKHLPEVYIQRVDEDGSVWNIPTDIENVDYVSYLAWLDEGNVPEPYQVVSVEEAN